MIRRPGRSRVPCTFLPAALAALGLAAACAEEPPPRPDPIRPVRMLDLSQGGRAGYLEYSGEIRAAQRAEVSFEVQGKILEFPVDEGQEVEVGDVLAQIDRRDYEAEHDAALAHEGAMRAERERARALFRADVISQQELDRAERNWEVANTRLRTTGKALEDTVLRAPFSGTVARKLVDDYANVPAKEPVVLLETANALEIRVNVPEQDFTRMAEGLTLEERTERSKPRVLVSAIPGRVFPAAITEFATSADPTTRTFQATLAFERPDDVRVLPGMTARVRVDDARASASRATLRVPVRAAVSSPDGEAIVWVVDRETMQVRPQPVVLGELSGDDVEIRGGLPDDALIVTSGLRQLREGMQVRRLEG